MTDFAIRYSYFDRKLGKSGHGEAIVWIEREGEEREGDGAGDMDIDADQGEKGEGEGQEERERQDAGESEGKSTGTSDTDAGQGKSEGQGQVDGLDLDDPEHRLLLEQHIKDALTRDYPEHNHGQLVIVILDCSQVPTIEGEEGDADKDAR